MQWKSLSIRTAPATGSGCLHYKVVETVLGCCLSYLHPEADAEHWGVLGARRFSSALPTRDLFVIIKLKDKLKDKDRDKSKEKFEDNYLDLRLSSVPEDEPGHIIQEARLCPPQDFVGDLKLHA